MQQRDVSRNWSGRQERPRDGRGRLLGKYRIVLNAIQVRTVERLMRDGTSMEGIADAIGVSYMTLFRILARDLTHIPRRGRGCKDRSRRQDPSDDEISREIERLRLYGSR
jgi:hypothetical protein